MIGYNGGGGNGNGYFFGETMAKKYLGDGVYVELIRDTVCLTTKNQSGRTKHEIYLGASVYESLIKYVDRAKLATTIK